MTDAVVPVDKAPAPGDAVRALILPRQTEIINKVVELAIAGDPRSAELCLKYLGPPAKPEERIFVPGLEDAPTLKDKSIVIINAVAKSLISIEAGEKVMRMLEMHTRAVTVQELAADVAALKQGRQLPLVERVTPEHEWA